MKGRWLALGLAIAAVLALAWPFALRAAVRVQELEPGGAIQVAARHGELRALLRFELDEAARVELEAAHFGSTSTALALIDPTSGQDTTTLALEAGFPVLELHGSGFTRTGTYVARLQVVTPGQPTAVFELQIESQAPYQPLGLRAAELRPPPVEIDPFAAGSWSRCVPIDGQIDASTPIRSSVLAPQGLEPETQSLPETIAVAFDPACGSDKVLVRLGDLATGRYLGVLDINGETIGVELVVRQPWWLVLFLVATGATTSFLGRDLVRYFRVRASNEGRIADRLAELNTRPASPFLVDELAAYNGVRAAQAANHWLRMDDVDIRLSTATRKGLLQSEFEAIGAALQRVPLPVSELLALRHRLERTSRLSARRDESRVEQEIRALHEEATQGFPTAFVRWLDLTRTELGRSIGEARKKLGDRWTLHDVAVAGVVLDRLEQYFADAESVHYGRDSNAAGLERQHVDFVERLVPAARWIAARVDRALDDDEVRTLRNMVFGDLPEPVRDIDEIGTPLTGDRGLRVIEGMDRRGRLEVGREVTFVLAQAPDPIDGAIHYEWEIDGYLIGPGGNGLTYVFTEPGRHDVVVRARPRGTQDWATFPWNGRAAQPWTPAIVSRLWRWVAEKSATFVGVVIAGAVAVAVAWSNRAFGGWGDYVALISTGLGVDIGFGVAPNIVRDVIESVRGAARQDEGET